MLASCVLSELDSSIDTWICKGEEKKWVITARSVEKDQKYKQWCILCTVPVDIESAEGRVNRRSLAFVRVYPSVKSIDIGICYGSMKSVEKDHEKGRNI